MYNSVFLDHEKDIEFMRKTISEGDYYREEKRMGFAICHNRPDTIPFLQELLRF